MKKVLCTICMRGNSKGVKNKNLKLINGKPLLYYTIIKALKSKLFDEIVVSSDSKKILSLSKKLGIINLINRPNKLATDSSGKIPVIIHALLNTEKKLKKIFKYVVDLDVTAPIRSIKDIKKSLNILIKKKSDNLVTATVSRKSPYFNIIEKKNSQIKLAKKTKNIILRRQDAPITYDLNPSIYMWKCSSLIKNPSIFQKKTEIYLMPQSKSFDIDNDIDLEITKLFLKKKYEERYK